MLNALLRTLLQYRISLYTLVMPTHSQFQLRALVLEPPYPPSATKLGSTISSTYIIDYFLGYIPLQTEAAAGGVVAIGLPQIGNP